MIVPTNTMIWASLAVGTLVDCTCVGVIETVGVVVCISGGIDVVDGGICVGDTVGWVAVGDGDTIVAAGETAVADGSHALSRTSRVKKMAALPIDLSIVPLPLMVIGGCPIWRILIDRLSRLVLSLMLSNSPPIAGVQSGERRR